MMKTKDGGAKPQWSTYVRKEYIRTMTVLIDKVYTYMVALDKYRAKFKAVADVCKVPSFPPFVLDTNVVLEEMEGIRKQFYTNDGEKMQLSESEAKKIVEHLADVKQRLNAEQLLEPETEMVMGA